MGDDDLGCGGGISDRIGDILADRHDDRRFAVCDGRSLVVLCGGALFAGEGAIGEILGNGLFVSIFSGISAIYAGDGVPGVLCLGRAGLEAV